MSIILTGATGFIGRYLLKSLLDHDIVVHVVVREGSDKQKIDRRAEVFVYNGQILSLTTMMKNEGIHGIVHLASLFLSAHTANDVDGLIDSNIRFGTHLLEAARDADVKWFLNTGTFWQHYENRRYSPVNLYAATKEAFETVARYYSETSGLIFTTIKLNDTFGSGDTRPKIFALWRQIAQNGENLDMSFGEQLIDISYIDDVVAAYERMIELLGSRKAHEFNNCSFAVKAPRRVTLKELAVIYEEAIGKTLKINWGKRPYREREVMVPWDNGESVPGWQPRYKLEEAIKKMIEEDDG